MATKTVSKGSAAHVPTTHVDIALSDIYVDNKWNTRSDLGESSGGPDEKTGIEGLTHSIKLKGQDTPVIVRPRRENERFRQPYFLVAGFRRYKAITDIAHETKNPKPTIKAFIRNVSEMDARELNIRENSAREDLSGPDLAFGVARLVEASNEFGGISQSALGLALNISQAYAGQMVAIANIKATTKGPNGKSMTVLDHWRETPSTSRPSVKDMYKIAKLKDADAQSEAYATLLNGKTEKDGRDPKVRLENQVKQAAKVGKLLGLLVNEDAITLNDESVFFAEYLDRFMSIGEDTKAHDRRKLNEAAEEAYTYAAENGDVKPTTEETEVPKGKGKGAKVPEAPKSAPAKGKGKASNGKSASAN